MAYEAERRKIALITSARAVMGGKTYTMASVSSVAATVQHAGGLGIPILYWASRSRSVRSLVAKAFPGPH